MALSVGASPTNAILVMSAWPDAVVTQRRAQQPGARHFCAALLLSNNTMTASSEPTAIHRRHSIAASMLAKVEQGAVTRNDLEVLRRTVRENPKAIPFLDRSFLNGTSDTPPPFGSNNSVIVRYVGMVQDQLETEYYLSQDKDGVKTHYRDAPLSKQDEPHDIDDDAMMDLVADKLGERQPLVVVPIPFSSDWIREATNASNSTADQYKTNEQIGRDPSLSGNKREGDETMAEHPISKRKTVSTPDTSMENDDSMEEESPSNNGGALLFSKQINSKSNESSALPIEWWPAGCLKSDPSQCPVLANMYYEQDPTSPRLRLNEAVQLVGVLSMDPMDADFSAQQSPAGTSQGAGEWNDMGVHDFSVPLPPPSLLPRLHVLCYDRISLEHSEATVSKVAMDVEPTSTANNSSDDRIFCIQVLAEHIFAGDEIAAEALLMALMSMAEREEIAQGTWAPIKTPLETTLGCASLNLVLSSQASCLQIKGRLHQVLTRILPLVGIVDLSREQLGKAVVSPAKNESGRFDPPSPLQLPRGSALIVDQSMLTEGPIEARAQETLRALQSVAQSHSMPYRFEGMMNYNFEADYRVIVLSTSAASCDGSKLLPCSMTMFLSDEDVLNDSSSCAVVSDKECTRIRSYLQQCRLNQSEEVPDEAFNVPLTKALLELAQEHFIERRAAHRKKKEQQMRMQAMAVAGADSQVDQMETELGEADFHRWLTVARLQARSRLLASIPSGEQPITDKQIWLDTLRLDETMRRT